MFMTAHRPAFVRILPFAVFIGFLLLEELLSMLGVTVTDARWLYPVKTAVVGGLLAYFWKEYGELRSSKAHPIWMWLAAPLVGVLVFALWVNLDQGWMNLGGDSTGYDPRDASGAIEWPLATIRILGAALVVPLMEELFWRSFLMRWIDSKEFLSVSPLAVTMRAMLVSSLIFGVEHTLWFAGIVAGLAYAWLYRASGNLWPAIIAHSITNGILGLWVLRTGSWQFW